jgi:hypothetical protein
LEVGVVSEPGMGRNVTPVFIGILPKRVLPRPEWLKCETVDEILSVSECMSPAPADRIDRWAHNEVGLYDTVELAIGVIEEGREAEYRLFAYRELPLKFSAGQVDENWDPAGRFTCARVEPDLGGWLFRGYDVVGRSSSEFFECSPLSCNGMAAEHAVNRCCLIDELDQAIDAARVFSDPASGVEPADYFIVEVFERP